MTRDPRVLTCAALLAAATTALPSCSKSSGAAEGREAARLAAPAPAPSSPYDHLGPGELPEGKDKLLGLPLPMEMKVQWAFDKSGLAAGPPEAEQVANFVRARVSGGKLSVGASQTLFDGVHIGADPRPLRIRIERARGLSTVQVMDLTPGPPAPVVSGESDADRWKRAGYDPHGRPIDPSLLK